MKDQKSAEILGKKLNKSRHRENDEIGKSVDLSSLLQGETIRTIKSQQKSSERS
jgi:hypothetical protein